MAPKKAGLKAFDSSFYDATSAPGAGNPFEPVVMGSGLQGLKAGLADQLVQQQELDKQLEGALLGGFDKPPETGPLVLFNPSTNEMFVNGALYNADDKQSALDAESRGYLDRPRAKQPDGDWQFVSPDSYKTFMNNIEDPSLGTLFARNFEIGTDNLKLLAGRGAQFLGFEDYGQELVDNAVKELYYNQPFQREFKSEDGEYFKGGAIDWFVANFAQQGPNLIESIAFALAGAGAGAVAGGGANPFTATGGAIYALLGKDSVKLAVASAAKKYMKGQALSKGEKKLLREFSGLTAAAKIKNPNAFIVTPGGTAMTGQEFLKRLGKQKFEDSVGVGALKAGKIGKGQAVAGGAFGGSVISSYAMGVADIYGEVRDTGVGDRGTAAGLAIPYAAMEVIPEFFLASRIFGLGPNVFKSGGVAKRVGKGVGVGGTLEGLTELGQESLLLYGTDQSFGDEETTRRLINSFAAGFAIGGPLGGGANLLKAGEPTNILNKDNPQADQKLLPAPPLDGEIVGSETPPQGQLPGAGGAAALPAPTPAVTRVSGPPDFVAGAQGIRAGEPLDTVVQTNQQVIPGQAEGQQGIMFPPEQTTAAELNRLSEPQQTAGEALAAAQQANAQPQPTQAELEAAGQLTLPTPDVAQTTQDLATPAAQETAIGQQLLQAANTRIQEQQNQLAEQQRLRAEEAERAQRQQEFDLAEQQRLNEQVAQLENARVEQILKENERLTQEVEERKAREQAQIAVPQRTPTQLSLPGMAAPKRKFSARREALRRGQAAVAAEPTIAELEQEGQMRLPFPEAPAPEITPLVNQMVANNIPMENIQEFIDDFQVAIDNNDLAEQDNIIAEMEGIIESFDRPRRRLSAGPVVEETGQPITGAMLTGQAPIERVGRGTERVDPETGETFISYPSLPTPQRRTDAVQVGSTEEVAVRQQTESGSAVRGRDTQGGQVADQSRGQERLRKASVRQTTANQQEEQRALREARQETRQKQAQESDSRISPVYIDVTGQTPIEAWNNLAPAGTVPLDRLPQQAKEQWSQLVAGNAVNGDIAQQIVDDNYYNLKLTAQEELNEFKAKFDTTTDFTKHGEAWSYAHQLMAFAFFEVDSNLTKQGIQASAIEYLNKTEFTPQQRKALHDAFVTQANAQPLEGTFTRGFNKGKNKPWLEYATKNHLLAEVQVALTNMPAWYTSPQQEAINQAISQETQGEVLGQDTADRVLNALRRQQAAGDKIDFDAFRKAYETALGKKGRKVAAEKTAQIQLENSRLLEDILTSHLERYEFKSFSGYNPVVELTSDRASVEQRTQEGGTSTGSRELNRIQTIFANSDRNYLMANGYSLRDFFDARGNLKTKRLYNGRIVPDPTPETQTERRSQEAEGQRLLKKGKRTQRENARVNRLQPTAEIMREMDSKAEDGNFRRADGKPTEPLGRGEIDLVIKQVLKKLKVKPTVTVVANVQELARTNPELYNRAKAGRPLGDFDTVEAVGYSVGDQVIIFSDYARTKEQIRLTVAHEALGHFGFRAFMPRNRLDFIFREIYKTDGHVRAAADIIRRANPKIDLLEAVEEVLAERAAALDVSMIARLKNVIKSVLEVIGLGGFVEGDPDLTRYFLNQSRKNLRSGGRGVVGAQQLALNLKDLQSESEYGRFQIEDIRADHATNFFQADAFNRRSGKYGGFDSVAELVKNLPRGKGKAVSRMFAEMSEALQTLDNKAQRSEGLSDIFKIFQNQSGKTRRAMSEYERLTAFTHTPDWMGLSSKGPTKLELEQAGEMLAYGALLKANQNTDQIIKDLDNLMQGMDSGDPQINEAVRQRLEEMGTVSREEFERGFTVTNSMQQDVFKTFTVTDNTWRIYSENRAAVNQAAIDVLMANMDAVRGQREQALENFSNFVGSGGAIPSEADVAVFRRVIEEYSNLYQENATLDGPIDDSIQKANRFLSAVNRAMWEDKKIDDWFGRSTDANGNPTFDNTAEFQTDRYRDIIDALPRLRALQFEKDTAFDVTNAIQNLFLLDTRAINADFSARRTLVTGYVPFTRRGKWQVRMQAYDASTGQAVELEETYAGSIPFFQTAAEQDAKDIAVQLQDMVAESNNPITYQMRDKSGQTRNIQFRAQVSQARQSQPLTNSMNLTEFMSVVQRLDIGLTPQERQRIITALTGVQSTARKSLQRSGNVGWDKDVIRSVAEHLETQAHVAGKITYSWQLNDIMASNSKFRGDPEKLQRLEEATTRGTEAQRETARKAYDAYAYQYSHMADQNAPVQAKDRNGNTIPNEGRGEAYREEAKKLLQFYADAANIQDSTEDILSGEIGSRFKLYAVLLQLGGSIATAAVNMMSMVTHAIPYLGSYNPNRGYGGGFGLAKSAGAMGRAVYNAGNFRLSNYDYMVQVANPTRDPALQAEATRLQQQHGLTPDEADAMLDATAAGVLQAAQFNALVGTSRGGRSSNNYNGLIKTWMSAFSYTEQLNRRTTFLAAYRMERERILASNQFGTNLSNLPVDEQAEIALQAQEFATKAVNTSQGEYAMYNRPEMARGNFLQYIFMYKQFVIVSVQLMKGMDKKGRIAMLTMLFLMAGMKGLPFADDLMDLIDTLAQKFGIKMKSVEEETARLVDAFIPGASPYFMRGFLDQWTGATISTRLGFGDLIPLSGAFKAKSHAGEYWREAENFFGPVYSGMAGLFGTGAQLLRYGAETVGLKDGTTRFADILRDAPSSAVRGLVDGMTYLHDGKITRADGTVLDNDVGVMTSVFRMMGFYPYQVMVQNDIIRMTKQTQAYVQDMKAHYKQAYIKAKLEGDRDEVRRILNFVKEYNRDTKGTEFYFKDFVGSANKSLKSAKKNSVNRYRKFAPTTIRPTINELLDIYGVEAN